MKTAKIFIFSLLIVFIILPILISTIAQPQMVKPMAPDELDLYERSLHVIGYSGLTVESGIKQIIGPPVSVGIYRLICVDQINKKVIVTFRLEKDGTYYKIGNRGWRKY